MQNPVVLGDRSEPQPDLAIVRARADDYRRGHPQVEDVLLLIEVAETAMVHDRRRKIPLYARHGIPVFWLLGARDASLVVFEDPTDDGYRRECLVDTKTPVPLPGFDDINVDLSGLA